MKHEKQGLVRSCQSLILAYNDGLLGDAQLPEDLSPANMSFEEQLAYFTLPMSLNYRRSSTQLWSAALATYNDSKLSTVYELSSVAGMSEDQLRARLVRRGLAIQPVRHTRNWHTIASAIYKNWGSISGLLDTVDYDYLQLKELLQKTFKKDFPYLSGPELFNYWCFVLVERCGVELKNSNLIDIAVDVHVRKASARLGLFPAESIDKVDTVQIAQAWRDSLEGSLISPIMLNVPLWAWSRSKFSYDPTPSAQELQVR